MKRGGATHEHIPTHTVAKKIKQADEQERGRSAAATALTCSWPDACSATNEENDGEKSRDNTQSCRLASMMLPFLVSFVLALFLICL